METQTKQNHLENDQVSFTIINKPHCVVEFQVKASRSLVEKAYKNAIKEVTKETSIPGFRKGKAPEEAIKKSFKQAIDKKWEQLIGQESFAECEKLAKIPVLNAESRVHFKLKSHSHEDGAEMIFQFESEPEISAVNLSAISLDLAEKKEVSPQQLDEILHKIRLFFAKWNGIEDRAAQQGDYVFVDLDIIEEDKLDRVLTNARLEIKDPIMANWMRELVIGMHIGSSKEGFSQADESASEEDKAKFTPKKIKITLNAIQEPILPALDDELAIKLGAHSLVDMKEKLKLLLEKQSRESQKVIYREKLSSELLKQYNFEVPGSLLYTEIQHRTKQLFSNPSFKKRYDSLDDEGKKEEFTKIESQATDALKLFYICRKILSDNQLTISISDLNQEINSPLEAMFADRDLANPNKTEEQKNLLMSRMLLTKAQDFIIDKIAP